MKKISIEQIFDDRGNYYYNIEGMNLSPYMFYLYKMIKICEIKIETCQNNLDKAKYEDYISSYKKDLDELFKNDDDSQIGIFFLINDNFYVKANTLSSFDYKNEIFKSSYNHFDYFYNELIKKEELNLNKDCDYKSYYRGRVIFDNKSKIYKIFISPEIIIKPLIQKNIKELFKINDNKVYMFCSDEQYSIK